MATDITPAGRYVFADNGDYYTHQWWSETIESTGGTDSGPCDKGEPHYTESFAASPSDPLIRLPSAYLGSQAPYAETVQTIEMWVHFDLVGGSTWSCRCAPCILDIGTWAIVLDPSTLDVDSNPVQYFNAIGSSLSPHYMAELGSRAPGDWPDFQWLGQLADIHHWKLSAAVFVYAWKTEEEEELPPPDPPELPDPIEVPLLPECPEAVPGTLTPALGPHGRVDLDRD